ncbi:probable Arginine permease [Nakaseomyces glabratus]|nr:probable Arginine permease [Nakaseomyces glabratus]SLM10285.1 probable Arginine permease [Nakaseomyces glabratus]
MEIGPSDLKEKSVIQDIDTIIDGNDSDSHNSNTGELGRRKRKTSVSSTQYEDLATEKDELLEHHDVKRSLKQRHIGMIALGGTIGTGLFIGIATPLANAGPVGALVAYLFMGTVVFSVTQSLGEMATFIPVTSSFSVFAQRFLSPALGAANGYMYFLSWCFTFALELSVVGQIIQFWTFKVPLAAWISIFWVLLTAFNMFPVKFYGEFEFWIASIKVLALMGFLIYSLCIVCGAGKTGPIGFRYWRNPGAMGPGIISSNTGEARFLGWVSSLINAAFTYQGTELVGITAGEAANPRKAVPRAIRKVLIRILLFYIGSLFFIGLTVPYNDPKLTSTDSYVSSSPFIITIQNAGTRVLPHIFNAVILILSSQQVTQMFMLDLVFSPKFLAKTTLQGVPYLSVLAISAFGSLSYMELSTGGAKAFNWLLNITGVAGFFAWLLISCSHVRFMQALKHRGISRDDLPYKALWMPWLAYYAIFFMVVIILIQGFTSFAPHFSGRDFVAAYISVGLFLVFWGFFQIYFRCRIIWKLEDVDIDTDRREIESVVWEDDAPKTLWDKFWDFVA